MKKTSLVMIIFLILVGLAAMANSTWAYDERKFDQLLKYAVGEKNKENIYPIGGNGYAAVIQKNEKEEGTERKLIFVLFFEIVNNNESVLLSCDCIEELWVKTEKDGQPFSLIAIRGSGNGPEFQGYFDGTPRSFFSKEVIETGTTVLSEKRKSIDRADNAYKEWYDGFVEEMFDFVNETKLPTGIDV